MESVFQFSRPCWASWQKLGQLGWFWDGIGWAMLSLAQLWQNPSSTACRFMYAKQIQSFQRTLPNTKQAGIGWQNWIRCHVFIDDQQRCLPMRLTMLIHNQNRPTRACPASLAYDIKTKPTLTFLNICYLFQIQHSIRDQNIPFFVHEIVVSAGLTKEERGAG